MSDQKEYRFPDEEDTPAADTASGFPDDDRGEPEEWKDEKKLRKALSKAERKKKKGASTRILLLVLLAVVLAGAGVYFYMGVPQPEPPPSPKTVKKQPIAVPPPSAGRETVATTPEKEKPADETEANIEPATRPDAATENAARPEEPETSGEPEMAAAEKSAPEVPAPEASPAPEPEASGPYAVRAGAFLLKAHLAGALDKIEEMGYEPQVEEGLKQVVMTRLRLGAFSPEEAEERMAELSRVAPGVFSLPRGEEVVVYAGSYYTLDKARSFADRLYRQGIRLEEETVELEVPLYLLSFGGFADREAAREAASHAREAGLDAYVVKKG